jgi:cytochrome c556
MKFKLALFVAVCTVLLTPVALLAEERATGVVKERMDLMETQKDAMKVIGAMAKGEAPFDADKAGAAAAEIETTAAEIVDLFPEGTVGPPAKPSPRFGLSGISSLQTLRG